MKLTVLWLFSFIFVFLGPISTSEALPCKVALSDQDLPPEQKIKIARQVVSLYNKALTSSDIIGFHGTSVAALKVLLATGRLPFSPVGKRTGLKNGIYISEISSQISLKILVTRARYSFLKALETAEGYAGDQARMAAVANVFGIPYNFSLFQNFDTLWALGYTDYAERDDVKSTVQKVLRKLKIQEPELITAFEKAKKDNHEGIILALSKRVFKDFNVIDSFPDQGLFIQSKDRMPGLPIKEFSGLKALGEADMSFLDELERINSSGQ